MKKESSNIKGIFNSIIEQKNEEADIEIKRKKLGFHKISFQELEELSNIFNEEKEELL